MKILQILTCVLVGCCLSSISAAQTQSTIQYVVGFPTGNLNDFISESSFRGASIDFEWMTNENIGVGFGIGWNTFYERKNYSTYEHGTVSLSGTQYRYTNCLPVYVNVMYYLSREEKISPFAGLGIGTVYANRSVDMGLYRINTEDWQFSLKPEAGVLFRFNESHGAKLALRYHAGFESNGLKGQSFLSLALGLVRF